MTIKGTKEMLTGDTATLIARALILILLGYTGANTEEIKVAMARYEEKLVAMEKRIERSEVVDASEHAQLRALHYEQNKKFEDFKDKYFLIPKPFNKK